MSVMVRGGAMTVFMIKSVTSVTVSMVMSVTSVGGRRGKVQISTLKHFNTLF